MLSFVCSIGNVPLAAVLWNGGISFGGVLAFIFADLFILPILDIYRTLLRLEDGRLPPRDLLRDDGRGRLIVEFLFQALGSAPTARNAKVVTADVSWNYTTYLNIVFLALAGVLVWRYFRRGGGWSMLKMMNEPMSDTATPAR